MGNIQNYEQYYIKTLQEPFLIDYELITIGKLFDEIGYKLWIVGGAVRDHIINSEVNDIDLATNATPDDILSSKLIDIFKIDDNSSKFGNLIFYLNDKKYEVTSLRCDLKTYGRYAEVIFTKDLLVDAKRRDFTFNALYLSLDGRLFDPLNAYPDVISRKIKSIGKIEYKIIEDHSRILRYFRFYAQFFKDNANSKELDVCFKNIGLLKKLSAERLRLEILKLFSVINSNKIIEIFIQGGVFEALSLKVKPSSLLPVINSIQQNNNLSISDDFRFAMAIKDDLNRGEYEVILEKFDFNKSSKKFILNVLAFDKIHIEDLRIQMNFLLYKNGKVETRYLIIFNWACNHIIGEDKQWIDLLNLLELSKIPVFPLKARDLVSFGYKEGKEIGQALREIESFWIESNFTKNKRELIELYMELLPSDKGRQ
tara:strand:- start:1190 stop:2467 length:1278 start_codon:yes stop_codon:yes gene_type:complete